ncbi:MAG TPA: hypothetical protein VGH80_07670 [Xanthomonadaceae bacterium]|jgi:hypothetical protein
MNIFRSIVSKAPHIRRNVDPPIHESPPEQASPVQRAPAPAGNASTKADEMVRLMTERRKRPNRT